MTKTPSKRHIPAAPDLETAQTPAQTLVAASVRTAIESATTRNACVVIAVVVAGAALFWLSDIFTPLALAIFLLTMIDAFAGVLKRTAPFLPSWAPITLSIVAGVALFGLTAYIIAEYAANFFGQLSDYGPKLNALIGRLAGLVGVEAPPSVTQLFQRLNPAAYAAGLAQGLQAFVANAVFVLVYLGFLLASRVGFAKKTVTLFPHREERNQAVEMFGRIRVSVERYLWIQTLLGFLIAAVSWAVMRAVGLENAFFWAFLIFVAGYIPIIGGAIGCVVPPVIALVQFPTLWQALVLLVALNVINFVAANIIQPRMQSDSLNLDPVVVLLALAFWGAIWGVAGMFLSTPLTVMAMVILAQFKGTHWIAVLLSGDGDPLGARKHHKNGDDDD